MVKMVYILSPVSSLKGSTVILATPVTLLITGGAGYIGSHTALFMAQKGYNIIILDRFLHQQTLPNIFQRKSFAPGVSLFDNNQSRHCGHIVVLNADFADETMVNDIFKHNNVQAVIHFAALIEVGQSVKSPRDYYHNNVIKTIKLLEMMLDHHITQFVFSSSCAVYGVPQKLPLTEAHPKKPISPYGKNKLIVEMVLEDFHHAYGLNFISLRYFNAAGAMPDCGLGEQHEPETHLIPLLLHAAYTKKPFFLFGDTYQTNDGSCIRDYLHVWDLAQAHWLALKHLQNKQPSDFFNLGTGKGFSVKEMITAVQKICNTSIKVIVTEKRDGDPPTLVADPSKACNLLGWKPQYSDLAFIIKTAHAFYTSMNAHRPTSLLQSFPLRQGFGGQDEGHDPE